MGVLEIRRGTGTFVGYGDTSILTKPLAWGLFVNQANFQQVIEARSVIEVALVGWAAERATDEEVDAIGRLLAELEELQDDMAAYVDADVRFHLAIADAAHNGMLANVLRIFQRVLRVSMETTYAESGSAEDSMALHREIDRAIRARDAETARLVMADHTSGGPLLAAAARSYAEGSPLPNLFSMNL